MKKIAKMLAVAGLAFGLAASASASNIVWTLENVDFLGGEVANGTFTTDSAGETLESFNINVTGGLPFADFTATNADSFFLPSLIGFFSGGGSLVQLDFASNLTSAGGVVHISSGYDGILGLSSSNAEVVGVDPPSPTPEPSSIPFLGGGLLLMGFLVRRKLIHAN